MFCTIFIKQLIKAETPRTIFLEGRGLYSSSFTSLLLPQFLHQDKNVVPWPKEGEKTHSQTSQGEKMGPQAASTPELAYSSHFHTSTQAGKSKQQVCAKLCLHECVFYAFVHMHLP